MIGLKPTMSSNWPRFDEHSRLSNGHAAYDACTKTQRPDTKYDCRLFNKRIPNLPRNRDPPRFYTSASVHLWAEFGAVNSRQRGEVRRVERGGAQSGSGIDGSAGGRVGDRSDARITKLEIGRAHV